MSVWPSLRARVLLQALLRKGWVVKRQTGSHNTLSHPDWPDYTFPFHDGDEVGLRMVARVAKHTGLQPSDL
jgi:predicted RNA binding protein YcfA (HicA-like mRNA interferase family)